MRTREESLTRLGYAIRQMRHESGLSQEELGHLAELHRTYVSGIERGVRNPSFVSLEHLLSVLGKQWKDLSELLE